MVDETTEMDPLLCIWCKDPLNHEATTCRQCQKIQNPWLGKLKSLAVIEILGVLASIAAALIAVLQALEANTTLEEVEKIKSDINITENRIKTLTISSLDIAVSRLSSRAQRISDVCSTVREAERESRELERSELPSQTHCYADIRDLVYEISRTIELATTMEANALTPDETESYIKRSCQSLNVGYTQIGKNNLPIRKSSEEIVLNMFGSDPTGCFQRYKPTPVPSKVATVTSLNLLQANLPNSVPVYLFINSFNNSKFYTTSELERDQLVSNEKYKDTWILSGTIYFAYATNLPGTLPVYRYFNVDDKRYIFTSAPSVERQVLNSSNWIFEGIVFYVPEVE